MKVTMKSLFSLCVLGGVFCISAAYSAPAQSVSQRSPGPVGLGPIGPRLNSPTAQQSRLGNSQQGGISDRTRSASIAQEGQPVTYGVGQLTSVSRTYSADAVLTSSGLFSVNGQPTTASLATDQAGGGAFSMVSAESRFSLRVNFLGVARVEGADLATGIQYSASSIGPGVFAVAAQEGGNQIQGNLFLTPNGWFFEGTSGVRVEGFGDRIVIRDAFGSYKSLSAADIAQLPGLDASRLAATNEAAEVILATLGGSTDMGYTSAFMVQRALDFVVLATSLIY